MDKKWRILTVASYGVMIIINALANIIPINNMTTGEISDRYFNLFTPAGITFSIWGVIYTLLFIYVISTFKNFDKNIGIVFIISSVANSLWIIFWHYNQVLLSLIMMLTILVTLTIINEMTYKKKSPLTVTIPFQVYWGWISVATIANVTVFLVDINWDGFNLSPQLWTQIMIVIGAILAMLIVYRRKAFYYATVFIWAYIGILIRHITVLNNTYIFIIITTTVMLVLMILFMAYQLIKSRSISNV